MTSEEIAKLIGDIRPFMNAEKVCQASGISPSGFRHWKDRDGPGGTERGYPLVTARETAYAIADIFGPFVDAVRREQDRVLRAECEAAILSEIEPCTAP